jgi:hypothetical protein
LKPSEKGFNLKEINLIREKNSNFQLLLVSTVGKNYKSSINLPMRRDEMRERRKHP